MPCAFSLSLSNLSYLYFFDNWLLFSHLLPRTYDPSTPKSQHPHLTNMAPATPTTPSSNPTPRIHHNPQPPVHLRGGGSNDPKEINLTSSSTTTTATKSFTTYSEFATYLSSRKCSACNTCFMQSWRDVERVFNGWMGSKCALTCPSLLFFLKKLPLFGDDEVPMMTGCNTCTTV